MFVFSVCPDYCEQIMWQQWLTTIQIIFSFANSAQTRKTSPDTMSQVASLTLTVTKLSLLQKKLNKLLVCFCTSYYYRNVNVLKRTKTCDLPRGWKYVQSCFKLISIFWPIRFQLYRYWLRWQKLSTLKKYCFSYTVCVIFIAWDQCQHRLYLRLPDGRHFVKILLSCRIPSLILLSCDGK